MKKRFSLPSVKTLTRIIATTIASKNVLGAVGTASLILAPILWQTIKPSAPQRVPAAIQQEAPPSELGGEDIPQSPVPFKLSSSNRAPASASGPIPSPSDKASSIPIYKTLPLSSSMG